MRDAPKCPARSKRSGRPCGGLGLLRADGTFTRHCYQHGGKQERLPPGDPERGGRPPSTFLYARFLNLPGDDEIVEAARARLGTLDDEIVLVRRNLARALERHEQQPKGGIPVSVGGGGSGITVLTNHSAIVQLSAELRKLEATRAQILVHGPPPPPPNISITFGPAPEVPVDEALAAVERPASDDDDA